MQSFALLDFQAEGMDFLDVLVHLHELFTPFLSVRTEAMRQITVAFCSIEEEGTFVRSWATKCEAVAFAKKHIVLGRLRRQARETDEKLEETPCGRILFRGKEVGARDTEAFGLVGSKAVASSLLLAHSTLCALYDHVVYRPTVFNNHAVVTRRGTSLQVFFAAQSSTLHNLLFGLRLQLMDAPVSIPEEVLRTVGEDLIEMGVNSPEDVTYVKVQTILKRHRFRRFYAHGGAITERARTLFLT